MVFFSLFKGKLGYEKKVNTYESDRLRNKECKMDKDSWICNKNGKLKRYKNQIKKIEAIT